MARTNVNIAANFAGQIFSAFIGIAFVPIYIEYIGVESYGIVGFFATIQALYALLDMGISATLSRELAVRWVSDRNSIRMLLRTLEIIYLPGSIFIAIASWLLSGWIAHSWLKPVTLSEAGVASAIVMLGVATAAAWPSSLYTAGLVGLQRQVLLNSIRIVVSTVGAAGSVWLLSIWPRLETYIAWQIVVGLLQSILLAIALYRHMPRSVVRAKFSPLEFKRTGKFAGGVFGITLVSLALTQADKLILSVLLPLEQFSYYTIAATLAGIVYRLVQPLFLAYGPRYSEIVAAGNERELVRQYHYSNQAMSVFLIPAAAIAIFFGRDVVFLWSRNVELTNNVSPIFSILVSSFVIHGLMNLPYALQLAYGWTRLAFLVNVAALGMVIPLFWFLGVLFGAHGVAWGWFVLALFYFGVTPFLMHRRILRGELFQWYLRDIAPVLVVSGGAAGLLATIVGPLPTGLYGWVAIAGVAAVIYLVAALSVPHVSAGLLKLIRDRCGY